MPCDFELGFLYSCRADLSSICRRYNGIMGNTYLRAGTSFKIVYVL